MKYQELMDEAKQSWNRQKNQHFDADDVQWITVNGAHIPLDDDGTAMAGGELKGENFSKAKSEESGSKSGKSESKSGKSEQKSEPKVKSSNAKAKKMSASIKNAFEDQDFEELSIAVEQAMKEMPVGSVMNFNGTKIRKTSASEFEAKDPWGGTAQTSPYEVFASMADSEDLDVEFDITDKSSDKSKEKSSAAANFSAKKLLKKSLKSITKEDAEALRESIETRHKKAQAEYDKACEEAEKEIASKVTQKTMPHEKSKIERAAYSKANAIAQKYTNESADDFECVTRIGDNARKVGEGAASVNDDIYYNYQYRHLKAKK